VSQVPSSSGATGRNPNIRPLIVWLASGRNVAATGEQRADRGDLRLRRRIGDRRDSPKKPANPQERKVSVFTTPRWVLMIVQTQQKCLFARSPPSTPAHRPTVYRMADTGRMTIRVGPRTRGRVAVAFQVLPEGYPRHPPRRRRDTAARPPWSGTGYAVRYGRPWRHGRRCLVSRSLG